MIAKRNLGVRIRNLDAMPKFFLSELNNINKISIKCKSVNTLIKDHDSNCKSICNAIFKIKYNVIYIKILMKMLWFIFGGVT